MVKPKLKVTKFGARHWKLPGGLHHKEGEPAISCPNGTEIWYINGEKHRIGGPACVYPNGDEEWWVNGHLHRTNGPARIRTLCGITFKEWWVNGERIECHRL